jgi:hypothetical protein
MNAENCVRIDERSGATPERFAVIVARGAATGAMSEQTRETIAETGATAHPVQSYALIVVRLEATVASCVATVARYAQTVATAARMFVTIVATGVMHAMTSLS